MPAAGRGEDNGSVEYVFAVVKAVGEGARSRCRPGAGRAGMPAIGA